MNSNLHEQHDMFHVWNRICLPLIRSTWDPHWFYWTCVMLSPHILYVWLFFFYVFHTFFHYSLFAMTLTVCFQFMSLITHLFYLLALFFFKDWSQTNKDNWHFILCYVDDNNYYLRVKHEIIATDLKDNCVDNRSRICQKCSDFAFLIRTLVDRHWSDSCRRNTLLVH